MKEILAYKSADGTFDCDCNISVEEWKMVLQNDRMRQQSKTIEYLSLFYNEPEHKSTCKNLSSKYGTAPSSYNAVIKSFGQLTRRILDRFTAIGIDGEETYWIIPMIGRYVNDGYFEWQLRDELAQALKELKLHNKKKPHLCKKDSVVANKYYNLIEQYSNILLREGGLNGSNELYKWQLLAEFGVNKTSNDIDYADQVAAIKFDNLVYHNVPPVIKTLITNAKNEYNNLLKELFCGADSVNVRIETFCKGAKKLYELYRPSEKFKDFHSERTAAALLTFYNPNLYTFFMPTFYISLCAEVGDKPRAKGCRYEHYMSIIKEIAIELHGYSHLLDAIERETIDYIQSDILTAQDLVFQVLYKQPQIHYDENEQSSHYEGSKRRVSIITYERSQAARMSCIAKKGCTCVVCGFNFQERYGDAGKDYIHVHHVIPISSRQDRYKLNVDKDLVPVCPNCHAMLHKEIAGKYVSVEELSEIVNSCKEE